MIPIAISQRVFIDPVHGERRDALDQRWAPFLAACGLIGVAVANRPAGVAALLDAVPVAGILLTGGNDLAVYGGDAPERDATERTLIDAAERSGLPLLGVCRGMQVLIDAFGGTLVRVPNHVAVEHEIHGESRDSDIVNSYHTLAALAVPLPLTATASAADGVVEAVRHDTQPFQGIMWHPERCAEPRAADIRLFRDIFGEQR